MKKMPEIITFVLFLLIEIMGLFFLSLKDPAISTPSLLVTFVTLLTYVIGAVLPNFLFWIIEKRLKPAQSKHFMEQNDINEGRLVTEILENSSIFPSRRDFTFQPHYVLPLIAMWTDVKLKDAAPFFAQKIVNPYNRSLIEYVCFLANSDVDLFHQAASRLVESERSRYEELLRYEKLLRDKIRVTTLRNLVPRPTSSLFSIRFDTFPLVTRAKKLELVRRNGQGFGICDVLEAPQERIYREMISVIKYYGQLNYSFAIVNANVFDDFLEFERFAWSVQQETHNFRSLKTILFWRERKSQPLREFLSTKIVYVLNSDELVSKVTSMF